jgi:hypothetical protein
VDGSSSQRNFNIKPLNPQHAYYYSVFTFKKNPLELFKKFVARGVDAKGKAIDNRTPQQKAALLQVITEWKRLYPNAIIQGHHDFPKVKKACPSFNAKAEYKDIK